MPTSAEPKSPHLAVERLRPGRHGLPRDVVQAHQRERLVDAIAVICTTRGYAATSVAEVTATAAVSRKTFYDFFENKEQCLLAAHDEFSARLFAAIDAACDPAATSPQRLDAALRAALAHLAADLPAAQLLTLDILALGPPGAERYHALFDTLHARLDSAVPRDSSDDAGWASIAAIGARVGRAASENDPDAILDLEDDFSAILLALTAEPA
jgi:AcrR family transcriptional regulator